MVSNSYIYFHFSTLHLSTGPRKTRSAAPKGLTEANVQQWKQKKKQLPQNWGHSNGENKIQDIINKWRYMPRMMTMNILQSNVKIYWYENEKKERAHCAHLGKPLVSSYWNIKLHNMTEGCIWRYKCFPGDLKLTASISWKCSRLWNEIWYEACYVCYSKNLHVIQYSSSICRATWWQIRVHSFCMLTAALYITLTVPTVMSESH